MLNNEAVEKILSQWRVPQQEDDAQQKYSHGVSESRFLPLYLKLPKKLRKIACGLYCRDESGDPWAKTDYQELWKLSGANTLQFLELNSKDRQKILSIPLPQLTQAIEDAFQWLNGTPYQDGPWKKGFRVPQQSDLELELMSGRKKHLVDTLLSVAELFRSDVIDISWLAVWSPYLRISYSSVGDTLPPLFAAAIDRGGKQSDTLLETLLQCGRNEHEHGMPGRHVTCTLLAASRPEGWEFVEKLLLAAQRQEGLRQSILEAADLANPVAFQRILRVILDHDLARFSAVARALNVWTGFNWDSASVKAINGMLGKIVTVLEDNKARQKAAAGNEPDAVYLGLWAIAQEDALQSIMPARKLLHAKDASLRYAAVVHLSNVFLLQPTAEPLVHALEDQDPRVAYAAAMSLARFNHENELATIAPEDLFERLERLIDRLPDKPELLPDLKSTSLPQRHAVDRANVASLLLHVLNGRPFTRMAPYLKLLEGWQRARAVEQLAQSQTADAGIRGMLMEYTADSSADVRFAAFKALEKVQFTDDERCFLESLLTRKAADLRTSIIKVLTAGTDQSALNSATRLIKASSAPQRLAGLEVLRELKNHDRSSGACRALAEEFRRQRRKTSADEETHLRIIEAQSSPTAHLSLENALGLMDPAKLSSGVPPKNRKAVFWTKAAQACINDLDRLIHEYRETPIKVHNGTELLGATYWGFPFPDGTPKSIRELPLRDVWEKWIKERPKALRDADGLELVRSLQGWELLDDHGFEYSAKWLKQSGRSGIERLLAIPKVKVKYPRVLEKLLGWVNILTRPPGTVSYFADCMETLCAEISQDDLQALSTPRKEPDVARQRYLYSGREESNDWRENSPLSLWHQSLMNDANYTAATPEEFERIWKLACWWRRPLANAPIQKPDDSLLFTAYERGLANLDDVAAALLGPQEAQTYGVTFKTLHCMTARRPEEPYRSFLGKHKEVRELVDKAVNTVVDIELLRGDTATVATEPASAIQSLIGVPFLVRILSSLGKDGFKFAPAYRQEPHRNFIMTHLASVTYPAEDETLESFVKAMKAAVNSEAFPEDRLIQLAFLAPQWVKFVEGYFKWTGMAESVYWFLAHMSFLWGSEIGAKAADGAGIADEAPEDAEATAVDEDTDPSTAVAETAATVQKLNPWQRLIAERTALTEAQRSNGAIDIAWFHRVHANLKPDQWQQLSRAARFASNPAQAKKAQLIADVLTGAADIEQLIAGIEQRQLKENVRLIGLAPLPAGKKREGELKRRYNVLQEYNRYARTLSGLTKPQAMQALEIGLQNLASTAGYADPIRLEWALGADELKDLAKGSVSATMEGVTVTLSLDEFSQPAIAVDRGGKVLKSPPPAVKKTPDVQGLYERAKEIKRKASRLRQVLEQAMCRGESFTAAELQTLSGHPLVSPLLNRLVLVGEGIMGYPVKNGKALQGHSGTLEPIKKNELLRIAHPHDLFASGDWSDWQGDCFRSERMQPFKQVFRELYLPTKQEKSDLNRSNRYAGQQVNPRQAYSLWGNRGWNTSEDVFKTFHELELTAAVSFNYGVTTPLEVEGLTLDAIQFYQRINHQSELLDVAKVPPRVFSEVMRDCDLVVSVAHRGGVDPEASASTVEMRSSLVRETALLLGMKNVRVKQNHVLVDGTLANYSIHLGSGTVHRLPGGAVCLVPVHSQHRGRLFLPFADDDPRSAEVLSKVILLARDQEIQDPTLLAQLQAQGAVV